MKQKHLLKSLLLMATLIAGTSAWADELTIGFEDATYTDWMLTTIKAQSSNSGVPAHGGSYYGGTDGKESGSVVTATKIASPQSIKFYVSKESTNTNASSVWQIKVSSDGTNWTKIGDDQSAAASISKGTWTEVTRDLSEYSDVYVGVFYSGTTAKRCIDDITITYGAADTRTATTITIDDTNIICDDVYTSTTAGSLAATVKDDDDVVVSGAGVTWSSGTESVATIDENTGDVTLVGAGTTVITASFAGDESYQPSKATYTLIVTNSDPNQPGTEGKPYTVAQAIEATPSTGNSDYVYISGIVSSFYKESIVADGSNYRYYISDDGTTTNQLLVYKGKGLENATFTSADDLKVGDEVVIYGQLTTYGGASEVASGNYIVSHNRPVDTTPSIEVSETSIEVSAEEAQGTITVTYNNITDVAAEVEFCDAYGKAATYAWITAEINTGNNNVDYIIDANTGEARTAYMKVYALDDETNDVYSDLITITQAAYVAPDVPVEPAQAGVGAFVKVTTTSEITAGNYLIVYEGDATHDAVAFDGGLETLDAVGNGVSVTIIDDKILATTATVAATFTIQPSGSIKSASGLYIGKAAYANGLETGKSALSNTFEIDDEGVVITAEGGCILRYNYAKDQLRFRYYKSGQQAIQLYKYDATATITETKTIGEAGYATYYSENALDFTGTGLIAYTAQRAGSKVTFTQVQTVPANTGVLLKGAPGNYDITVVEGGAVGAMENLFVGVLKDTKVEAPIFVLMNGDEGVGFYKTSVAFTVGAHTAYLPYETGARNFIAIGEATAIEGVAAEKSFSGEVYNLQGQRVTNAVKGLYIVNGKKVVLK